MTLPHDTRPFFHEAQGLGVTAPPVTPAEQLRTMRRRLGLTQAEAAAFLGCGLRTLHGWEHGERRTPRSAILALEAAEDSTKWWGHGERRTPMDD